MPIEGLEELNARFRAAIDEIGISRTQRFITELVFAIEVESATITPVDTSFLINSKFSRIWRSTSGWNAEAGYGANYAMYVHNKPGTLLGTGLAWKPDAEPQFLAKAIKTVLEQDLDAIIENQYKI